MISGYGLEPNGAVGPFMISLADTGAILWANWFDNYSTVAFEGFSLPDGSVGQFALTTPAWEGILKWSPAGELGGCNVLPLLLKPVNATLVAKPLALPAVTTLTTTATPFKTVKSSAKMGSKDLCSAPASSKSTLE